MWHAHRKKALEDKDHADLKLEREARVQQLK